MKFTCSKQDLKKGVAIVSGAVKGKSPLPIQECILIEAGSCVTLSGNSIEIAIKTDVAGMVLEPGSCAVNARLFGKLVDNMGNRDLTIACEGNEAVIKGGKAKLKIPALPADQFVPVPDFKADGKAVIGQAELKAMIDRTAFSLAASGNPLMMSGWLECRDGKASLWALDGHRVAMRQFSCECGKGFDCILPGRHLKEVSGILSSGKAKIWLDGSYAVFDLGGALIGIQTLEGKYYNVGQMTVMDATASATVDRMELEASCNRCAIFLSECREKKPMIFEVGSGVVHVAFQNDAGTLDETLDGATSGEVRAGFNPAYILDILRAIDGDEVTVLFGGQRAPCMVKGDGYLYLTLPVNI